MPPPERLDMPVSADQTVLRLSNDGHLKTSEKNPRARLVVNESNSRRIVNWLRRTFSRCLNSWPRALAAYTHTHTHRAPGRTARRLRRRWRTRVAQVARLGVFRFSLSLDERAKSERNVHTGSVASDRLDEQGERVFTTRSDAQGLMTDWRNTAACAHCAMYYV